MPSGSVAPVTTAAAWSAPVTRRGPQRRSAVLPRRGELRQPDGEERFPGREPRQVRTPEVRRPGNEPADGGVALAEGEGGCQARPGQRFAELKCVGRHEPGPAELGRHGAAEHPGPLENRPRLARPVWAAVGGLGPVGESGATGGGQYGHQRARSW